MRKRGGSWPLNRPPGGSHRSGCGEQLKDRKKLGNNAFLRIYAGSVKILLRQLRPLSASLLQDFLRESVKIADFCHEGTLRMRGNLVGVFLARKYFLKQKMDAAPKRMSPNLLGASFFKQFLNV